MRRRLCGRSDAAKGHRELPARWKPRRVKEALDAVDMLTFFGHIKFDTSADAHGLQIGHYMVYVQWQKDDAGNLGKQVVWPPAGATAPILYPHPLTLAS